jgi:hypothetical protein
MGLFSKLFGKSEEQQTEQPAAPVNFPPATSIEELMEQFGAIGLEKQSYVADIVGNNSWNFDMGSGTIKFGQDLTFPIQILGTISHSSQTWLWAWANDKSGIPQHLTEESRKMKEYGDKNGIQLLSDSKSPADIDDLHMLGCIASGIFQSSCYYIADYGQGAMLVTIKAEEFDKIKKDNHLKTLTIFPQLTSSFEINNHKKAFKNYLMLKGYSVSGEGTTVKGSKNGNVITGQFDDSNRLTSLNGEA